MCKKILLVGSQGYLGSRLTDYLQEYGYECAGADVGFFQYGVLYYPNPVTMLNKEARTLTEKDIEGFEVVLLPLMEIGMFLHSIKTMMSWLNLFFIVLKLGENWKTI